MLKYALIAGLLMTQVPVVQQVEAVSVSDIKKLAMAGKDKFCRKASFFSGVVSVRSFEGALCTHPGVAAIATKICGKVEGFAESKCATNAKKALAGKDPETVLEQEKAKDPTIAEVAQSVGE